MVNCVGGIRLNEGTAHYGLTRRLLRLYYSISQKKLPPSLPSVGLSFVILSLGPSSSQGTAIADSRTRPGGLGFVFVSHLSVGNNSSYGFSSSAVVRVPLVILVCLNNRSRPWFHAVLDCRKSHSSIIVLIGRLR